MLPPSGPYAINPLQLNASLLRTPKLHMRIETSDLGIFYFPIFFLWIIYESLLLRWSSNYEKNSYIHISVKLMISIVT